jgi:hypothetical protein
MYVWMQTQVLPPGMKNTDGSTLNPVMAVAKRAQCVPHSSKQVIVKPFTIQHADTMECLRYGEDNMIMIDRISMIYSILDPERLVGTLALGTVTIAATVVADLILAAMVTPILMTTQG